MLIYSYAVTNLKPKKCKFNSQASPASQLLMQNNPPFGLAQTATQKGKRLVLPNAGSMHVSITLSPSRSFPLTLT